MKFKYQKELDHYIGLGYELPSLNTIESKESFRFVFAESPDKNHIPPYLLQPSRLNQQIKKGSVDVRGFALSNLESEEKAIEFYRKLRKHCKNIEKSIGDSLSSGVLHSTDGMITEVDSNGHFDLFEFEACNLCDTFNVIKQL